MEKRRPDIPGRPAGNGIETGIFVQTGHKVQGKEVTAVTEQLKRPRRPKILSPEAEQRLQLMEGMARTRIELNQAYAQVNIHSDPDLIESCVFTINALRSRYSYFIRQIKLLDEKAEAG